MCRCRWCALLEGVLLDGSSVAAEALWLLQMESCADRRTSCAWSSCPTCQYVTCTRHACVRAVVRRAVRSAWVALRGLSVEGGYATRRYSHDASVACRARPTSGSGRCERSRSKCRAGPAPVSRRGPRTDHRYGEIQIAVRMTAIRMAGFRRSPLVASDLAASGGAVRALSIAVPARPGPARASLCNVMHFQC